MYLFTKARILGKLSNVSITLSLVGLHMRNQVKHFDISSNTQNRNRFKMQVTSFSSTLGPFYFYALTTFTSPNLFLPANSRTPAVLLSSMQSSPSVCAPFLLSSFWVLENTDVIPFYNISEGFQPFTLKQDILIVLWTCCCC